VDLKKRTNTKTYLGDIALSYEIINRRSKTSNFDLEFDKVWIHGYLHLLGYDHKKIKDYKVMKKIENKIIKIL
jgi:probable rRNA maturation factor